MLQEQTYLASGILEAISKWHAGEVTVGTLAKRLDIEPVVLIAALDANGICDHIGQLKNPQMSHITVMTLAYIMLTNHRYQLRLMAKRISLVEKALKVKESGNSE